MTPTACKECSRLLIEFSRLAEVYDGRVKMLAARVIYADSAECNTMTAAMNEARMHADLAHIEFEQHKRQHGSARILMGETEVLVFS